LGKLPVGTKGNHDCIQGHSTKSYLLLVLTPQISGWRSTPHFVLFLLCLYFGFIAKPK
jgi:hypothetical protein